MSKYLRAASAVALTAALAPQTASALDGDFLTDFQITEGSQVCSFRIQSLDTDEFAYVALLDSVGNSAGLVGGRFHQFGINTGPDLSASAIASTCGFTSATIINVNPPSETYATDSGIAIRFSAVTPSGDTYEYTAGMTGVTGTFAVTSTDFIPPTNQAPTANAGTDINETSGNLVTLMGTGTDADGTIAAYQWSYAGGTGDPANAVLSDPTAQNPTFTDNSLQPGDPDVFHIFNLVVTDDDGAQSVADSVTVTFTAPAANQPPVANAGLDQEVGPVETVTLMGSGTDADGTIASYSWQLIGGSGNPADITLSDPTAQNPTFTTPSRTPADARVTYVFRLTVTDDQGGFATDDVLIGLNSPANQAPTSNAGMDQQVTSGSEVTLMGSGTDADGTIASYQWTRIGGTGDAANAVLSDAFAQNPTFTDTTLVAGDQPVTHVFSLTVTDDFGDTDTSSVTITINPPANLPPQLDVGPPQTVTSGDLVTLRGGAIDTDGTIESFLWERIDGTGDAVNAVLSDPTITMPTFTDSSLVFGDQPVTHVFRLTATDNLGDSNSALLVVTIEPPANELPIADAGMDQVVTSGTEVTLMGSGTDADGTIASYAWTRVGGTGDAANAVLDDATSQTPAFTDDSLTSNDTVVTHIFELVVTDNNGATSVADTITVSINPPDNEAPVADAGMDQEVTSGDEVTLMGSGTDADGTVASYTWTRVGGTGDAANAVLSAMDAQNPTFMDESLEAGDDPVTHIFELSVTDDDGAVSVADTVTITVNAPENILPVADAGQDVVAVSGETVTLTGAGTDEDGTIASYAWTRVGGTGDAANAVLDDATAEMPSFTDASLGSNDVAVTHVFELVVTDNLGGESVADTVTVTINPTDNMAPVADAGQDQSVVSGTAVTLSGSGTDEDGTIASFTWLRSGGTGDAANAVLDDAGSATPSFTDASLGSNDAAVTHVFDLVVTDDDGAVSVADSVTITINPTENMAPVADAGQDITVISGEEVTLMGAGTDEDGTIAAYSWTRVGGTGDADNAVLSAVNVQNPTFTDASLGANVDPVTHIFELVVTDDDGAVSVADTITVTVGPIADVVAPETPLESEITTVLNDDGSITLFGTVEPSASVMITFPDERVITVNAALSGAFSATSDPDQPTGDIQIVVIDAAGNTSAPLAMMFFSSPEAERTQEEIAGFMAARSRHFFAAQPDLTGLLSKSAKGNFNLDVTQGRGMLDLSTSKSNSVWAELKGSWSEVDDQKNSYFFGVVGSHVQVGNDTITGAMLQFDRMEQDGGDASTDGTGYLVGPYFVTKVPGQPFFLEGRYLMGKTENTTTIDGFDGQDFETDRTFAKLRASGDFELGTLILSPNMSLSRLKDTQLAFTDNGGRDIGEQVLTMNEVTAGLDFTKVFWLDAGDLMLSGGIESVWNDISTDGMPANVALDNSNQFGRANLEANFAMGNGATFKTGVTYDGIGDDDFESWGVNFGIETKF